MKLIPLSETSYRNHGKYIVKVDDEDYDYLMKWSWTVLVKNHTCYAFMGNKIDKSSKVIMMHRLIMKTPKGMVVDHIDHNGLNNQKSNLRNCTRMQNASNKTPRGLSKYLGVDFIKCTIKGKEYSYWRARVGSNYKSIMLGRYKTEIDAAKAYDIKAKEIHGEFANLNFK